jgi:tRNA G18 (ribose-2'-O)-methylase SpoU
VKIIPPRGYFEIGIYQGKTVMNLGTLWRSAYQLGAAGIFTIGQRMPMQASDTLKAYRHIPLRRFDTFEQFMNARPLDCPLIGVEMGGKPLVDYPHPQRATYLLGAEDTGLPHRIREKCQSIVSIESTRSESYNVAVAGSLVMYHRNVMRTAMWGAP